MIYRRHVEDGGERLASIRLYIVEKSIEHSLQLLYYFFYSGK